MLGKKGDVGVRAGVDQAKLLREMKDGCKEAFERFYAEYAGIVFGLALRLTGDSMEAEDVCHDVLLEAVAQADRFDPERGSLEAWLAVKTRSRCLDRLRKRKRLQVVEPEAAEGRAADTDVEGAVFGRWAREQIAAALQRIPAAQRQAIVATYVQSLSQREASAALGRPLGTVKSLVRYGLANLKKQLAAMQEGGERGVREAGAEGHSGGAAGAVCVNGEPAIQLVPTGR